MSVEADRKESLYEYLFPPQKIMPTHFVDNFDGDILNERWNLTVLRGTGTGFMVDDINEGFNIRALGTPSPQFKTKISFNGFRQYNNLGCTMIGEWRGLETTNNPNKMALVNISSDAANTNFIQTAGSTVFNLTSNDGATTSSSSGSAFNELLFQNFKIDLSSTLGTLVANGILDVSHTTNLPNARLEPTFQQNSQTANVQKNMRVRFAEAFNH